MEHAFNVNIAKQFDIDTAVFLQHLKFWTFRNLANKKYIYDGLSWTFNTLEAFTDIFPYWTRRQLERIINNCVKNGLVVKGNYNQTPYDRTCWYALTPKSYCLFPELCVEKYIKLLYDSISPNGEINFVEWGNQFSETVTPIPDTYTDTSSNTTTTTEPKPKPKKPSAIQPKPSSSSFSSKVLSYKTKNDERTDDEFLEHVEHHMKNNNKGNYNDYEKQKGILVILKTMFELDQIFQSKGFVTKSEKIKGNASKKSQEKAILDAQRRVHEKRMAEYRVATKKSIDDV